MRGRKYLMLALAAGLAVERAEQLDDDVLGAHEVLVRSLRGHGEDERLCPQTVALAQLVF